MVTEVVEDQVVDSIDEEIDEQDLVDEVVMEEETTNQDHLVVKESHFLMIDQSLSRVTIDHNQIHDM